MIFDNIVEIREELARIVNDGCSDIQCKDCILHHEDLGHICRFIDG